jgi:O-antigen/teichoic acid export membrane protein
MTIVKELLDKVKLPSVATAAFKYTAANLLNAMVPVLLLPILTAYLSKEDYGIVSMFQVMVMIALPFAGFNSQGAIEREFFNSQYDFSKYVTNSIFILLLSGGLLLAFSFIFKFSISSLTNFPSQFIWLVPVYCICNNVCEIVLSVWRVNNRPSAYGLFRITRTLIEIGLSVFLVTIADKGWLGRVEAMVLAASVFFGLSFFFLFRSNLISLTWDNRYVKDILKFGVPLIPHTLGGVIMIYSDRIFITNMVGLADTGSYTVGYQVAMAISLLQSSFNLAWVPWFYGKLNLRDIKTNLQIVKITYWYFLIIILCALGLTLVSPLLFKIFIHKSYYGSIQFVFWIAIGFAFDGMYKMVVNYIFYLKKTYIISLITFTTAGMNLFLNYFFITWYGAVGAAIATATCMLFEFLVVWWISSRIYSMPWLLR